MRSDRIESIHDTRENLSGLGMANSSAVLHPAGTVVLCRTAASAGYSAIMAKDMAVSQDIATWRCGGELRPRYLLLCLRAMRRDLLDRLAVGSTHKTIYMPDIESIRIPVPSLSEQDAIVEEVWDRLSTIDDLADTLTRQIGLLRERRQALITAAVTGELDVA
jgi:type I restriction enzyme S subunit